MFIFFIPCILMNNIYILMNNKTMTIQVISDIHGSFSDLRTAIDSFAERKPDVLLLCGDFLNHGPRNDLPSGYDTKATAALLNEYKDKIICVRGNCDSEVDQMMLDFPCLAAYTNLFFPAIAAGADAFRLNGRIFVHHGHLYDRAQLQKWLPEETLVISGHTHVTVLEEDGGLFYLNPGSISIPKCADGKNCALIETDAAGIRKISLCSINGEEIRSASF